MLLLDVRYAVRLIRRAPVFSATAILSLALGIGANTAIFSLFYTILFRQLPVSHPGQLVEFVLDSPRELHWEGYWDWRRFEFFRGYSHCFSGVTGTSFDNLASVRLPRRDPETLTLEAVPGNYFQVLGLDAALGRLTDASDEPATGMGDVAIVSWSYWERHFRGGHAVLGQPIYYNGSLKTIIGVAPRDYVGPRVGVRTDVWIPARQIGLTLLARLGPGVSIDAAQAEVGGLYRRLLERDRLHSASGMEQRIELLRAGAGLARVRDQYRKPLVVLIAIVGLLLLLTCFNLAGMLLARAITRRSEIAIRMALGASRSRLGAQMLTESLLLSMSGAVCGSVLAYFGTNILVRIMASGRAFEHIEIHVHPDPALLFFIVAVSVLTGLLFGAAPAIYAFHFSASTNLHQAGKGGAKSWRRSSKGLVAAQVALSLCLLSNAIVLTSYLRHLRNFNLGFHARPVLLVTLDSSQSGYRPAQLAVLYRNILDRIESMPGVHSASVSGCTPLEGCGTPGRYMSAEGQAERVEDRRRTSVTFVSPHYFGTLGIPLIAGRDLAFEDANRSRVVVINRTMARRYFRGANPVGKHIVVDKKAPPGWFGGDQPYEVVGVVGDAKTFELRGPVYPIAYFNMFQEDQIMDHFEIRTAGDPASAAMAVRTFMRAQLPAIPIMNITTLSAQVDANIVPERLISALAQLIGALGVALAGVGLYGLMSYSLSCRTHELGVRIALGASKRNISHLVLRDVFVMLAGGLFGGAGLVYIGKAIATRLIPDLPGNSSLAFAIAASALVAVALIASSAPLRRAIGLDPMASLRHE